MPRLRIGFCLLVCLVSVQGCRRPAEKISGEPPPPCTPRAVWAAVEPMARRYHLDPRFAYALVAAESGFDPKAHNGEARGLMQLTPGAWQTVSEKNYDSFVWDWRENLQAGIDYLAQLRQRLHQQNHYSPGRLAATFHYGYQYVADRDFDLQRIAMPPGEVWQKLWQDDEQPLPAP